jgi:hypothetical protein
MRPRKKDSAAKFSEYLRKWKRYENTTSLYSSTCKWLLPHFQCCGMASAQTDPDPDLARKIIEFFSVVWPRLRTVLQDTLKITFLWYEYWYLFSFYTDWCMFYPDRIEILTIYKNFLSNQDFFLLNFLRSLLNRKDTEPKLKPEPQFEILALAPGGSWNGIKT